MHATALGLTVLCLCGLPVASAQAQAKDDSLANAIELLRTNVRANKADLIGRALALPDSQAAIFWPMYREYEVQAAQLWDERIQLIRDYIAVYDTLSDAKARDLMQRVFAVDERRVKLNKDQFNKFSKKLPAKTVAHFFQLDGFLNRVIELRVAAALPEVK